MVLLRDMRGVPYDALVLVSDLGGGSMKPWSFSGVISESLARLLLLWQVCLAHPPAQSHPPLGEHRLAGRAGSGGAR